MLSMGEGKDPLFQDPWFQYGRAMKNHKDHWVIDEADHDHDDHSEAYKSRSSSSDQSSSFEASTISNESLSSIDTADDASSSISSLSSSNSNEGLYDLSELVAELPIKRGLSKYYQGKSESFTCLSRVTSVEDLAKKVTPYKRKLMKTSKSYGGLDTYKSYTLPKRVISKRGSLSSSSLSRSGSSVSNCRPPLVPVHENLKC